MKQSTADHGNVTFMPTSTVVLQTSLGNMSFDLAGAQFPLLTAQFVNFARSKYWNGVVVREVIPDIAAFFAHDTDSYIQHMFTDVWEEKLKKEGNCNKNTELETTRMMSALPLDFYALYERAMKWKNSTCQERNENDNNNKNNKELNLLTRDEQRQCIREEVYKSRKHFVSALHVRLSRSAQSTNLIVSKDELPAVHVGSIIVNNNNSKLLTSPFHINRAGLLLVEVTSALATPHTRTDANMEIEEAEWHYTCKFAITLSNNRNMDFLTNKNYIVIGAISESDKVYAESWQTLKKIRLCPLTSEANVEMQSSAASKGDRCKVMRSIVHYDLLDHANEQNNTHFSSSPISTNNNKHECFPRPIRAIRVVHVYVLPTLGAERYVQSSKMIKGKPNSNQTLYNTSSSFSSAMCNTNTLETSVVAKSLEDAGCFRYWANNSVIKYVNAYLAHLIDIQTQLIECTADKTEKNNESKWQELQSNTARNNFCSADNVVIKSNNSCIKCGNTYKSIIRLPEAKKDEINIHSNNNDYDDELSDNDSVISFEVIDPNAVDEYNNSINRTSLLETDQNDKSKEAIQHFNNNISDVNSVVTSSHSSNHIDNKSRDQRIDESLSLMMNLLDGITDLTIRPAPNVLFVCKLNPITDEAGLQICFSQFGAIKGINVIRDKHTQRSLCYAFIEFDTIDSCAAAFQKMNNVLIDDFRIKVDFSQSVSKVWRDKQRERNKRVRSW